MAVPKAHWAEVLIVGQSSLCAGPALASNRPMEVNLPFAMPLRDIYAMVGRRSLRESWEPALEAAPFGELTTFQRALRTRVSERRREYPLGVSRFRRRARDVRLLAYVIAATLLGRSVPPIISHRALVSSPSGGLSERSLSMSDRVNGRPSHAGWNDW
jgi:hypothetical protein